SNILISFLLTPRSKGAITAVVQAAVRQQFTLLVSRELLDEVLETIKLKQHLARRIDIRDANRLVNDILQVADVLPPLLEVLPSVTRDPKDDYLLAYALVGKADYLVTGD